VDCVAEAYRDARQPVTVAGGRAGRRPVVVGVLIALNVAVYALTVAQAGSVLGNADSPLFAQWALVPAYVSGGEWWRLVTAGFLHIGPIHLLFNMLALWIIGRDLEVVLGRVAFLAVYLVGLLGGATAVVLFSPPGTPVAGASGAVFGLMGGLLVVVRRMRIPAGPVIGLIVINIALTFALPNLSQAGHFGGLVVGALATAAVVYAPARNRLAWQVGALGGMVAVMLAAVLAVSTL
jgi:membrane associated rhomboid family serine protease